MFPRFAEFPAERREQFRRFLAQAAEDGVSGAALVHGAWLFDTNTDRERGARLVTDAYAAEDEWGLGMVLGVWRERLSDDALARVERLAEDGYPWAYSILAYQRMARISDNRDSYSADQQAAALAEARDIALKGVLRGDSAAVVAVNRIDREFDAEGKGLARLADVLGASDPLAFVASHPEEMESAYVTWRAIPVFETIDGETLRLVKISATACSGSIPSK
jgi:hypothetical protein